MARANRHFIPGYTWHITHRCHKKEFLLNFDKDKKRYIDWLFEAKKRYGLQVLNYMVTSNHIHLLISDNNKDRDTIPNAMRLIAGRTAQEYNKRKNRKGAFWEDRYHATAIQTDKHLLKCMLYIDANMVRAGVVKNPLDCKFCGLHEVLEPKKRYSIIDQYHLKKLLYISEKEDFKTCYLMWLNTYIGNTEYESKWSESIAVGTKIFIDLVMEKLGFRVSGRKIEKEREVLALKEEVKEYSTERTQNMYEWNEKFS